MKARRQAFGFTLIEVLVGSTILAVMMTLLTSALFSMTRTTRVGEARLDDLDATQLVRAFVRGQLGEALPMTEQRDDVQRVLFDGQRDTVRFVGHLPAHAGGGGLQFLELRAEVGSDGAALVLYYRSAWPDTPFVSADRTWQRHTLLTAVGNVRYRYFGSRDDETAPTWVDEWRARDRLPELIRVEIDATRDSWAPLVVEVRAKTAVAQPALFRLPPEDRV